MKFHQMPFLKIFFCAFLVTGTSGLLSAQDTGKYDPEANLKALGISLPEASNPVANYVNAVRVGNLIFLAGKGPKKSDGTYITGKLGADLTVAQGRRPGWRASIN